ncbi:Putative major facilitator superfamily, MFS transporter superfamily [Colletotrichum destructivum]|uniref:Major facilitator superfamily, MFS transporter superfamily n=1 Tax=Colletotrichum destructivum TaxID=34406 RepID=A0AAX4IG88_9PEZI|nr:Putative major facilitator superfamily, MFS transporter superfamily [Colletotrichum destructivum]
MADIKAEKLQPESTDMAEVYAEKVVLSEHNLELERALQNYVPDSAEEKALVRKLDLYMGPTLWFMYILAYIDRQNIGNAKVAGMEADLQLDDSQYAMLLSIFFIGYLVCEVPSNMLLTRSRPSYYLPGIMIVWGTVCAIMSVVKNYEGMLALRFFLGCIEAGFFPGVLYVMTCWYKKAEIGKRFSIFYTASVCSGAVSGLLAGAITGNMEGVRGIRGWRWLYLIEGVCTVGFAIIFKFVLLDFPETTKRLSLEERQLAVVRMIHDRQTTAARHGQRLTHWQSLKAALADPRTYVFVVLFTMDLGSCTISYFIPTIVKQMGYTSVTAQYMTIPIWMVGAVFLVVLSYTADRTKDRRWHITGCMCLSFVCTVVCVTVSDPRVVYAMLCFYIAGLYTALPLMLNWASEVISLPAEKRAVVVALVNSVGNLSAVYGSRLWPSSDGPRFVKGFATTGAFTGFGTLLAALIPLIFSYLPAEGNTRAERDILARERELVENARSSPRPPPGEV